MNRKFFTISILIILPLVLFMGFITKHSSLANTKYLKDTKGDESELFGGEVDLEYKSYKEGTENFTLILKVKNKTKYIGSVNKIDLTYNKQGDNSDLYIKGHEKILKNEVYGINPGESREIEFKIPKEIELINKKYDTKNPVIIYNMSFYRFRLGNNNLFMAAGSSGGNKTIKLVK